LSPDNLTSAEYDSTRVRVEGVLTGVRETGMELMLEMQDGAQSFVARLTGQSEFPRSLPIGGRLELTGVYAFRREIRLWTIPYPLSSCCWIRPQMSKSWHGRLGGHFGGSWSWSACWRAYS